MFLKKRGGPEFGIGLIFWCSDKYSSGFEGALVMVVVGSMSLNKQCESFFARELNQLWFSQADQTYYVCCHFSV
jgi:hypothetical protein